MMTSSKHKVGHAARHAIDGASVARIDHVTEKSSTTIDPRRDRTPRRRRTIARRRRSWLVWVDGYLRSDGVRVAGHYRTCLDCPHDE